MTNCVCHDVPLQDCPSIPYSSALSAVVAPKSKTRGKVVDKHTPGPWHNRSKNYGYDACHVCGPKHADGGDYAPICIADTVPNAHLIAAAPDLLAAVRVAYEFFINPGKFNPVEVERMYEAAIAKAKGRQ